MTLVIMAALVPLVGLLLVLGRYNASRVLTDWTVLAPRPRAEGDIEEHVALETAVLDATLAAARGAHGQADVSEVVRLLGLAEGAIAEAIPDRVARIKVMSRLCRMAAAVAPLPAVPWRSFQLGTTSGLAALASFAHHLLVSTHERFWLRLQVLQGIFRLSARAMATATRRAPARAAEAITLFDRAAHDWKAGDQEFVESVRVLLTSLAARPKAQAVTAPQR